MTLTRDQQRLFKIDAEIIDLRYLYEREKMREIELGKTTLLMSRAFKNRLEVAVRVRTKLAKAMQDNPSQRKTYEIELQRRLEARENAYADMQKLELQVQELGLALLINPADEYKREELRFAMHEIPIQKRRIKACERSYMHWAGKEESVKVSKIENKLPRGYSAKEDITKLYGTMPQNQEIVDAVRKNLTPQDVLGNDPNWAPQQAVNDASLDLLSQFSGDKQMEMPPEEIEAQEILELENKLAHLKRPRIVINTNVVAQNNNETINTETPKEE